MLKAYRINEISFDDIEVVDFQKNRKLMITVNLLSFVFFILFYILFDFYSRAVGINTTGDLLYHIKILRILPLTANVIFIAGLLLMMSIHELIHGFFFYIYTGEKPLLGFKSIYAYAASPGWYIRKNYFQIITLSPVILMTAAGLILMPFIPRGYSSMILLLAAVNAAGSICDIWISIVLARKPDETYVNDSGISARICCNRISVNN